MPPPPPPSASYNLVIVDSSDEESETEDAYFRNYNPRLMQAEATAAVRRVEGFLPSAEAENDTSDVAAAAAADDAIPWAEVLPPGQAGRSNNYPTVEAASVTALPPDAATSGRPSGCSMFTLRYSQEASVLKWDEATFTDCRPCEADAMQDEIIELARSLNAGPVILKHITGLDDKIYERLPRCMKYGHIPRRGPLVSDWPLGEANEEARRVCQEALDRAREGHPNLQLAKAVHDRYERKGYLKDYPALRLGDPTREPIEECDEHGVWRRLEWKTVEPIGWGDEEVTDDNREENADGTASFKVRTTHFADPWGAECFNVVELFINVEVVPSEVEMAE